MAQSFSLQPTEHFSLSFNASFCSVSSCLEWYNPSPYTQQSILFHIFNTFLCSVFSCLEVVLSSSLHPTEQFSLSFNASLCSVSSCLEWHNPPPYIQQSSLSYRVNTFLCSVSSCLEVAQSCSLQPRLQFSLAVLTALSVQSPLVWKR